MTLLPLAEGIVQIAFVVRDLDRALAAWSARGVGPWRVFTFDPELLTELTVRGEDQPYAMRLALASGDGKDYELIQPLDDASVYAEHLNQCGEGLHHLGYYVPDIASAIAAMTERGYAVLQTGSGVGASGDGAYAYFDTRPDFGCIIEAIQRPSQMWEPERLVAVEG